MDSGVYWIGADGNYYVKTPQLPGGVINFGSDPSQNQTAVGIINSLKKIDDPNAPQQSAPSGGGGTVDTTAAERAALRNEIASQSGNIDSIYNDLFTNLGNVVKSRGSQLEKTYGDQLKSASDQYTEALPQIDQSYAALGSYDSTQRGDARGKAKSGFDATTKTIGDNKNADFAKLGQYEAEQRAKFNADKTSAQRNIERSGQTTDVAALRDLRNSLEDNLSTANVTKATLTPDGQAAQAVQGITGDNGRYDAAINALDSIIKSSMASDVKAAAVKAVTDSAGLSDADKKKVQAQYGNVYAEQAAL